MNLNEACKYIKTKLGVFYNPNKVRQQLLEMEHKGLSYADVCERIAYWYDIKDGDASKSAGGIAIINYIEREFQEWKEAQTGAQRIKDNFKNFKLDNEPPQVVHVKMDTTYKLPNST